MDLTPPQKANEWLILVKLTRQLLYKMFIGNRIHFNEARGSSSLLFYLPDKAGIKKEEMNYNRIAALFCKDPMFLPELLPGF